MRTHMLVAIGSARFVLIPLQTGTSNADLTRVLQGLIAGVGFVGAGTIIWGTKQLETQGLTTAAGIWVTAAIGMAAGMGRESIAVLSTLVSLFVLSVVPWIHRAKKKTKIDVREQTEIVRLILRSSVAAQKRAASWLYTFETST